MCRRSLLDLDSTIKTNFKETHFESNIMEKLRSQRIKLEQLTEKLQQKTDLAERLAKENSHLKAALVNLERKCQQQEEMALRVVAEAKMGQARLQSQLHWTAEQLHRERGLAENEHHQLKLIKQEFCSSIKEKEMQGDELQKVCGQRQRFQGQIKALTKQKQKLQQQITDLQSQCRGYLELVEVETDKNKKLIALALNQENCIMALDDKLNSAHARLQQLNNEICCLNKKYLEVEAQNEQLARTAKKLTQFSKRNKLESESESEKLNDTVKNLQTQIANLKTDHQQCQSLRTKQTEAIKMLACSQLQKMSLVLEAKCSQLEACRHGIAQLQKMHLDEKTQRKRLQLQLHKLVGQIAEHQSQKFKLFQEEVAELGRIDKLARRMSAMPLQ